MVRWYHSLCFSSRSSLKPGLFDQTQTEKPAKAKTHSPTQPPTQPHPRPPTRSMIQSSQAFETKRNQKDFPLQKQRRPRPNSQMVPTLLAQSGAAKKDSAQNNLLFKKKKALAIMVWSGGIPAFASRAAAHSSRDSSIKPKRRSQPKPRPTHPPNHPPNPAKKNFGNELSSNVISY